MSLPQGPSRDPTSLPTWGTVQLSFVANLTSIGDICWLLRSVRTCLCLLVSDVSFLINRPFMSRANFSVGILVFLFLICESLLYIPENFHS